MRLKPLHIFFFLCSLFLIYSISIYTYRAKSLSEKENANASQGRLVWQKYNCQACHQLYGLGGYLGPDLTNIISAQGKDDLYIKAMIRSGTKQMPAFDLSDKEETELIGFLKSTNTSGIADPRQFEIQPSGMVEQK